MTLGVILLSMMWSKMKKEMIPQVEMARRLAVTSKMKQLMTRWMTQRIQMIKERLQMVMEARMLLKKRRKRKITRVD